MARVESEERSFAVVWESDDCEPSESGPALVEKRFESVLRSESV